MVCYCRVVQTCGVVWNTSAVLKVCIFSDKVAWRLSAVILAAGEFKIDRPVSKINRPVSKINLPRGYSNIISFLQPQ